MKILDQKRGVRMHVGRIVQFCGAAALCLVLAASVVAEAPVTEDSIDAAMELAARQQYDEAVALFERIKQERPETIESINAHKIGVVYAVLGDRARHEAHCRWLMDRYRDAELPSDAERSVKSYALFPSADDPALLEHTLERTRYAVKNAVEKGELEYLLWFHASQGMAEYRTGNYDAAIEQLDMAAPADNIYISSLALPYLAMTELARGNDERANALLEQAREAATKLPDPESEEYLEEGWTDTLTTQFALREAERVFAASE